MNDAGKHVHIAGALAELGASDRADDTGAHHPGPCAGPARGGADL
jgi:hypothetical protein